LDGDESFEGVGAEGVSHDFFSDFHVEVAREVVSDGCADDDNGGDGDDDNDEGDERGAGGEFGEAKDPDFFEGAFVDEEEFVFEADVAPEGLEVSFLRFFCHERVVYDGQR